MAEAIAIEAAIAEQAAEIRGDASALTPDLFLKLWPLLTKPIPEAFIQSVPKVEGKPYESTGIKSVQVQIDRMNNVLTPLWWWDTVEYDNDGKLATVTVFVGDRNGHDNGDQGVLMHRSSRGGVERGSSTGNVYKGSYTNAAKLAFARIGVGHEVYLGATDLDPDVSEELANASPAQAAAKSEVGPKIAKKMVDRAWDVKCQDRLQLAASHAADTDVGDCSTKQKAIKALAGLTFDQAERVDNWISRKADEAAADE
jgi:hypothetical protein